MISEHPPYEDSGEHQIVLSKPVAVTAYVTPPKLVLVTKFLAWLTGALLAAAVLVALVSVSQERNDVTRQIATLTDELACRARASFGVSEASAGKQSALAAQSALVGEFVVEVIRRAEPNDPEYLDRLDKLATKLDEAVVVLRDAGRKLDAAVAAQRVALEECGAS